MHPLHAAQQKALDENRYQSGISPSAVPTPPYRNVFARLEDLEGQISHVLQSLSALHAKIDELSANLGGLPSAGTLNG